MFTGLEMRAQWNHLEPTPGLKHYLCEHSVWGIDCMIKTIPNPSIHYIMCTYPLESNYTHTHTILIFWMCQETLRWRLAWQNYQRRLRQRCLAESRSVINWDVYHQIHRSKTSFSQDIEQPWRWGIPHFRTYYGDNMWDNMWDKNSLRVFVVP